jgi:hypothetical protein
MVKSLGKAERLLSAADSTDLTRIIHATSFAAFQPISNEALSGCWCSIAIVST